MKELIIIALILLNQNLSAQTNLAEEVFWDIIGGDTSGNVAYTATLHEGMFDFQLKHFKENSNNVYRRVKPLPSDSIVITNQEQMYLLEECEKVKTKSWAIEKRTQLRVISVDSHATYLSKSKDRKAYIISHPIFIRNNSVCLVFCAKLCCGGIYGPVELAFYRKEDNQWERWITISGGAF